jgi:hypothetical protein
MYGGNLARPDQDQVLFVYPFYVVFLLWPLVWFPYSWVQAFWMVAVLASLLGGVVLTLRFLGWQPHPLLLGILLFWAVVFYNSTRTIILGQFAAPVFLFMAGTLWCLRQERDGIAGGLLAWTTLKPQMAYLFIPALLLWAISQRRRYFVASFAAVLGLLSIISFLLSPRWPWLFVEQVLAYPEYTTYAQAGSPFWIITHFYWPWLGQPVNVGLSWLAVGCLLHVWRRLPRLSLTSPAFIYAMSVTLLITNLIVPRTSTTNYVMLYIPVLWLLQIIAHRWQHGQKWVVVLVFLSVPGMWYLFLATRLVGEHPVMYLPLPFMVLLGLLYVWHRWQPQRIQASS